MSQSEQINELATALSKCQSELKPVPKATKGHFKGGYADLTDCWENCRESLTKNGLSITQTIDSLSYTDGKCLMMKTMLMHSSGQWISSTMPIICKTPDDIQKIGSSVTYTRRYMLCSILGISPTEDDDGNEAKNEPSYAPKQIPYTKISTEKVVELNQMFQKCSDGFYRNLMDKVKGTFPHIVTIADFNDVVYMRVKENISNEIERMKKVQDEPTT